MSSQPTPSDSASPSPTIRPTATVILAAGYGTRMRSKLPKVLHRLAGRPLVEWSLRAARGVSDRRPVLVVGHGREQVQAYLGDQVDYVVQEELLGTGHAVMQAMPVLRGQVAQVIVLYADMPLLQEATLQNLRRLFEENQDRQPALAMLTIERDDPQGFGRVLRDAEGRVLAVVEEPDCTPEQLAIRELNAGIYCFDADWLWENLPRLELSSKGEYYLTDLVGLAAWQGRLILTMQTDPEEVYGVNNRVHLAQAGRVLRRRINERHMLAGVTLVDPETTYIDDTVTIGQDTIIWPGCYLEGETHIGADCTIGPNCRIVDTVIADGCRVTYSVLESARMDAGSEIGPFGHLRKGAHLGEGVHMGNFGEVKNSYLGPGVKMGHFSYVGDAVIGANVNIGAGTITCNYDGKQKHRTILEDNVFLGSGTLLVAPVRLGKGAHTGAGSVVTRDVPPGTLVYGVPARPHGASPLAEPDAAEETEEGVSTSIPDPGPHANPK